MKMKKTLCLIMALAMVFGLLSACGGGDGKTDTETPEYTYVPTYTELGSDIGYVYNTVVSGGLIYVAGEVEGEEIVEQYQSYDENGNPIRCSFCGKEQGQVRRLVKGPTNIFICDECVASAGA